MKRQLLKALSVLAIASTALPFATFAAQAQQQYGITAPIVSGAGTLNRNEDHYIEVQVNGTHPVDRIKVVCVTFHQLSGVTVTNAATRAEIPAEVAYGFENFTVTFEEPIQAGTTIRLVMEDSRVRGQFEGLNVPYRVFAVSSDLGEIPIGTAIVEVPQMGDG
ncbi:MAG: hypothetical protein SFY66_00600 [Oculatellaceae cyanobacterium bins.114]|nr:hypothetical protein [Oculatellaceae cyanobacterium bins.114]